MVFVALGRVHKDLLEEMGVASRLTDAAFAAGCRAAGLKQSGRVVVALSGGVDSTALCWLAGRARFKEVTAVRDTPLRSPSTRRH